MNSIAAQTPDTQHEDLPTAVARALGRLWAYLKTWQTAEGRIAGMVATWWSSTAGWAGPHPMNDAPIMLGLLSLHRAGIAGGDWLAEASRVGDGLLAAVGDDGRIDGAWGDIPGKPTGPILHVAPAEALSELFIATGRGKYLDAAVRILRFVDRQWGRGTRLHHRVVNQELRWAQALLSASAAMKDATWREQARRIGHAVMADRVGTGEPRGAFYQGGRDDKLILVYVGKCLNPLLELHREFDVRDFRDNAVSLADYLLRRIRDRGVFINFEEPAQSWPKYHYLEAICYRAIGSSRALTGFRRRRIRGWRSSGYPSFVARAGDSVRGLWALADNAPAYREQAVRLTRRILDGQLAHGGIRNAYGWEGDPQRTCWQDVICPTRWNGYAFHLLCELAGKLGGPPPIVPGGDVPSFSEEVDGTTAGSFYEDGGIVRLARPEATLFEIDKPTATVRCVVDDLRGEATGPRRILT